MPTALQVSVTIDTSGTVQVRTDACVYRQPRAFGVVAATATGPVPALCPADQYLLTLQTDAALNVPA